MTTLLREDFRARCSVFAVLALALYGCGCASSKPTERYPFPIMLDPVTEVTPNVHVK